MQVRHLGQGLEIVEVARTALGGVRGIQQPHGAAQPDPVPDDGQGLTGGARLHGVGHELQIVGERQDLGGHLGVVEPVGDGAETGDVEPAPEPLGEPLREAP